MYSGKNGELYGDLEETILACLLIDTNLFEHLKVEEKHFKKFAYVLTFFKGFYKKYKCMDITLMLSKLNGFNQMEMMDMVTYLSEIFVLPSHFEEYQNRLIERYKEDRKEKWLKDKIYEKATEMYMGNMSLSDFYKELKRLNENVKKIDWR